VIYLLLALLLGSPAVAADPVPTDAAEAELPQTADRPENDARVDALARGLLDAIVRDDPAAARPFFFPLAAYRQVKAIQQPDQDWQKRLVAAFERDIHALATSVPRDATFVSYDVPAKGPHWVDPGREWNKLGYYRVFGTRLRYVANGKAGWIPIKSMISWRGRWYIVHLSGYQ
jgi:hypothetical protein